MDAERLKQVEEIYHAALELPVPQRRAFIEDICGKDKNLLSEIESLLLFDKELDNFIDQPPASLIAEVFSKPEKESNFIDKKIGHYNVKKLLGKGGMGEVYLAEDTKLNRQVALKILPQKFAEATERMDRFVREAKSASALNHPNIITIHEIGTDGDTNFITTEYIEGETLCQLLKDNKLSQNTILEIAIQIASALDAAHRAGIVHRDIKPENVMIRPDGLVKILDFGVAKLSANLAIENIDSELEQANFMSIPRSNSELTNTGIIIGTPNYMSPEQAQGKMVDARSDIFSFGIVLYEMLAGKKAFAGENNFDVINAILHKEPQPINQLLPQLPQKLQNIIYKSLKKNREKRYQTAKDLVIDLRDAKHDLEFQNKLDSTTVPTLADFKTQFANINTDERPQSITSSAEFITQEIKKYKYRIVSVFLLVLAAVGIGYWNFFIKTSAIKQIESIAVMPFINESGSQDGDYLSDGMTETLISNLSQVPNLSVKARASVFRYKGKDTNIQTIGKELKVQAILNGQVIQRGDQLVLIIELIDTASENVIWSRQYNRSQSDVVSLQSEITRDVTNKIKTNLSSDELKVSKVSTTNPDAYQAYLKGRYYWNRRTSENLTKAIEQFNFAIEKDPNYALAYAGLADCYAVLPDYAGIPTIEVLPMVKNYAERAIALDNQLAESHASLARVYTQKWQWFEAEQEFKKAIELNPNYATAYHWYSLFLRGVGRFDESATMIKRAQELDPLSSIININVSQVYQLQNNHNASIENTLKVIEIDPNYAGAYNNLALSYLKLGRNAEAIANFEKAVELGKRSPIVLRNLGYCYGVTGNRTEALKIVRELEEKYEKKESLGELIATVYAGLGDNDKVFEWLEKDFQNKENVSTIRWGSQFESIRGDSRYKDLLKRMGLPE